MNIETVIRDAETAEREAIEAAAEDLAGITEHGEMVAAEFHAWLAEGGIDELAAAWAKGVL